MSSAEARPSTRDRLLDATVSLIRTKGAAGSGTKEILDLADAPRGSFYFHFPGGKDQLVLEAVDRAASVTLCGLIDALANDRADVGSQITAVFSAIEAELLSEDYAPGCAVGVTTLESATTSPSYQEAVDKAFATWTSTLAERLAERGASADQAAKLADLIVAAMEGATMLARAHKTPTPLRNTAEMLAVTMRASGLGERPTDP